MKNNIKLVNKFAVTILFALFCGMAWADPSVSFSSTSSTFNSVTATVSASGFTPTTYNWEYKVSGASEYIGWSGHSDSETISVLRANTTYTVKVTAIDAEKNEASHEGNISTSNGACVTLSLNGDPSPTKVPLQWSIYSSCSASTAMSSASIKNITITVDDNNPIVLTRSANGGADFPSSYTVSGLNKNTTYNFTIDVYYAAGGEIPISHTISATTTGSTGCTFVSSVKETIDDTWKGGQDFADNYTIACTTVSESPVSVQIQYTVPDCVKNASGVDYENMKLGLKKTSSADAELREATATRTGNADDGFTWTLSSEDIAWAGLSGVGDSLLVAVKVPVTSSFYATKFLGYAVGVGCNEAYIFNFSKRSENQKTFTWSTSANMVRFAYRKADNLSGAYIYKNVDNASGVHEYTIDISDFDIAKYEFRIYDKDGVTTGIKLLQSVY